MEHGDEGTVKRGRPRRGDRPDVPWNLIEREYVFGEVIQAHCDGTVERRFPTMEELSKKFGVGKSLIGYRAKRFNWRKQREKFDGEVKGEVRRELARQRALSISDTVAVLDDVVARFRTALEEDRLPTPTIADVATAIRVKQSLLDVLDVTERPTGLPSLADIQALYRKRREEFKTIDPRLAGVVDEVARDPDDGSGNNA